MQTSIETPKAHPNGAQKQETVPQRHKARKPIAWGRWILAILVVGAIGALASIRLLPTSVDVAKPESRTVAETVSSSGVVQGHVESVVGAQVAGIVTELFVDEGSRVKKGQILAQIQDNVAQTQLGQAQEALQTARAALVQARMRPQASDIRASEARVRQAESGVRQQSALVERARLTRLQLESAVRQSQAQADRAAAAVRQAESRLALAKKTLDRKAMLVEAGAIPKADFDQAQSAYDVAEQDRISAVESAEVAELAVGSAQDASRAGIQDQHAGESSLSAARAQLAGAREDLAGLRSQPRIENVMVAEQRVAEAEAAVKTASAQAKNTDVAAPFDGTVTEILTRPGASPSLTGLLRLVGTADLEIKLDLDETNLKDMHTGQRALITSPLDAQVQTPGHVSRIGVQIDSLRGTLEVYVVPEVRETWLRPGQTLNVNVVTNEKATRIFVPATAIQRTGDQTVVYIIEKGRAAAKQVQVGLLTGTEVPVLRGLDPSDQVIRDVTQVVPGQRVKARP